MFCPTCKSEIPDGSPFCPKCGTQITIPQTADKASSRSITAMILGIIGIIACGCLGPIALILGWLELNRIKKGLSSPASKTYALVGLVLGIVTTVIIVVIIPILAAIAIPNFLAAKHRAQVSRTHGELRSCATALEAYYIDFNAYPQPDFDAQHNPVLPQRLTTPVAYITSLPCDTFSEDGKQRYRYYTGETFVESQDTTKPFWIIAGLGPDQKLDIDVTRYNPQDAAWGENYIRSKSYDPANGTNSRGDIIRTGPE
ncbi:MAG: DUF4190 domain-containing protein [bacterium]